ncbi:hypothetical protein EH165_03400 [Nakamurella antarctica]|uniref:SurA N-terminal domain-containing protein n=1 Tax=Nakamurella antarctica TaxID=1902245 RepID=A0A3G8ZKP0_9ACTN|nr:hypothetical protein [Nakamurella antarctica]AZI57347.1 hypothetical protein EH165_03400 [Nakamurella antarctica]
MRKSAVALVVLLFGVAGCTPSVSAAAVVGGKAISTQDIDARAKLVLEMVTKDKASDRGSESSLVTLSRNEVTTGIRHQLLVQTGASAPLDTAYVSDVIAKLGGEQAVANALYAVDAADLVARSMDLADQYKLLTDAVAAGVAVTIPTVKFDLVQYKTVAQAQAAKSTYSNAPATFAAAAAQGASQQAGQVGFEATPLTLPTLVGVGLFSARPGDFLIVPQGASAVLVNVTDVGSAVGPVSPENFAKLSAGGVVAMAGLYLAERTTGISVEVNPRYGSWDSRMMQVVAAPGRA